jgi:inosine/xanthosine triphosphatase
MRKVIIASKNPVKINAVEIAFNKMFPDENFEFEGASVPSEVSDQPFDNQETMQGAFNRANNASKTVNQADFWVGIEGGIQKSVKEMEAFAWIVIKSKDGLGKARTGTFFLPKKVVELIEQGKELGEADDIVFGHVNSKQKDGAVGILTGNVIDRAQFYTDAIILALISFKNPDHY